MIVTELAEGSVAEHIGYVIGLIAIPVVGLVLLIVGLRQRSQRRRPPPFANPMGPPGYPPPSPYPPGYPPPPPPTYPPTYPASYPPRPRGSSSTALIVLGSLLLGFGVLGIAGKVSQAALRAGTSARSADVGQCIAASEMKEEPIRTATPQDCNRPDSIFEVAAKGGSSAKCPDGKLEDSKYAYHFDGTTTLCLILNLKEGQCYVATGTGLNLSFAATACDSSQSVVKVVKRVDGSTDAGLCPEGAKRISYPSPARLYCFERLEN